MSKVIIVDLDGTLSCGKHRLHLLPAPELRGDCKAWDEFNLAAGADAPILPTIRVVRSLITTHKIIIVTGRSEVAHSITVDWLKQHRVPYHELIMRGKEDHRKDIDYKQSVLEQIGIDNIECAFDDLEHVAKHFRSLGVVTYLVTHYDEDNGVYQDANKNQNPITQPEAPAEPETESETKE